MKGNETPKEPRYTVLFHSGVGYENRTKQMILGFRYYSHVSRELGVSEEKLLEVLREWGDKGHPETYRHFLERRMGTKKHYEVYLTIWNYRGEENKFNQTGVIKKERTWGNGYQTIGTHRASFYLAGSV